jgi:hypothetical protein
MRGVIDKIIKSTIIILFVGCADSSDTDSLQYADLISTFDFETADQRWVGGISDYPVDYKDSSEYVVRSTSAQYLNSGVLESNGLSISADNPHGELFYFFKRKIHGLKANKKYKLDFEFLLLSQLQNGVVADKSEDLFLKIGAVNFEPKLTKVKLNEADEFVILNVDKGEMNKDSGADLSNIGSIRKFTNANPEVISGNTFDIPIDITTDGDGVLWLVIGVDSGIRKHLTFSMVAVTIYYREY